PVPLHSSQMHNEKMLPSESGEVLGATLETAGKVTTGDAQSVVLDAATNDATAQLNPLQTATRGVVAASKEIQQLIEIHGLPERKASKHLRQLLSAALDREGPAADREVLLGLTQPGPIELQVGSKLGSSEMKKMRQQLARTLRREKP